MSLTGIDLVVLVVYMAGVTILGAWLGRGAKGASDYFLGSRSLPWWAVLLSVVATETSTLTFLSIPGVAYLGDLTFMQLTLGYLLGRVAVAGLLLPLYARGELKTAYQLLEARFGPETRRFASAIFMGTRLLADSVRLFATAIPLALITGWPYPLSIAVIGVATVVYTYLGGIKAVVWIDALQMALYLGGAVVAAVALQGLVPGGWSAILSDAAAAGKTRILDVAFAPGQAYTLWSGVLGGAVFSMASHGTDQLIVQRILTTRSLRDAQWAMVGSGVGAMLQFLVFLLLGLGLWSFYAGAEFARSDEIFATFIVESLPVGITGLLIAGVFAAAMSSLSSSINALASTSAYDFWAPRAGAEDDDARILRAGRVFTLVWAALLVGGAIVFLRFSEGAAVEVALAVASLVYGGLLGAFLLGMRDAPVSGAGVRLGMAAGIGLVTLLWLQPRIDALLPGGLPFEIQLAWPWYPLVGAAVTIAVARLAGPRFGTRTGAGR